jgi:hypothetical protein
MRGKIVYVKYWNVMMERDEGIKLGLKNPAQSIPRQDIGLTCPPASFHTGCHNWGQTREVAKAPRPTVAAIPAKPGVARPSPHDEQAQQGARRH